MIESTREPLIDAPTFERLAERESPALLQYFVRRVDPIADAADLLADVLLVAWRRRDVIPPDAVEARMWLFGVARKTLNNHRRWRIRHDALAERLRGEVLLVDERAGVEVHREEALALLQPLNLLDREILTLVYWDGFRLDEVATLLKRNASTVRARHARALNKLRRRSASI